MNTNLFFSATQSTTLSTDGSDWQKETLSMTLPWQKVEMCISNSLHLSGLNL